MISLCNDWRFTPEWSADFASGTIAGEAVRLPHTVREVPLHYAAPEHYEMICGYRRILALDPTWRGKQLILRFDGAAHIATVYLNGRALCEHRCGYTAFTVNITDYVNWDGDNIISVRLDCTENPEIPPFGFIIDYLTYGGLYREVWLEVKNAAHIDDVYLTTPTVNEVSVDTAAIGENVHIEVAVETLDGETLAQGEGEKLTLSVPSAQPWSPDSPTLYNLRVMLTDNKGVLLDERVQRFGFRTAEFRADGFYLNGQKTFLRGLNRHQCYPYIGYAAPKSLQVEDARILKQELGCNAVRTSHYPQSRHFIDACDELGLLVFTEIPGWQHLGDEKWKAQTCENVREMVLQYRNYTSIILWGVRVNESLDDDELYSKTNAIAHELDPSRPTSGVRYLEKSSLLEDVYAYNDFSHTGDNAPAKPKKAVTPDMNKGYLISECNGHMFPTKPYDTWERRQEHALRHARVQAAAQNSGEHAGCFGWCMFDYPTHKDCGSGDRVCYHGIMDTFRNPKLAAALYASQAELTPVLDIGSSMDIGDYPAGNIGTVYAFTNADRVDLYKNDVFVTSAYPAGFNGLAHAPIAIDDTIGQLLETQEGYQPKKAALIRECLCAAAKYGFAALPMRYKLKLVWAMARYKLKFADGVELYGKYVSNWGGESTRWRFDAVKDEKTVASVTKAPSSKLHLDVRVSAATLAEGDTYDMAAVRIRVLDEYNNIVPYAQLPVRLALTGAAQLVGGDACTLEGGMGGAFIKTISQTGKAELTVSTAQTEPVTIEFNII